LILQRDGELYATCSIVGAVFYIAFYDVLGEQFLALVGMAIVFVVRLATIFANLKLPEFIVAGHTLEDMDKGQNQ